MSQHEEILVSFDKAWIDANTVRRALVRGATLEAILQLLHEYGPKAIEILKILYGRKG